MTISRQSGVIPVAGSVTAEQMRDQTTDIPVLRAFQVAGPAWRRLGPRLPLVGILGTAAVLYLWRLSRNGYGNAFYAAAVRSMTQNWHNFFFGAFDPAGFITVDKPPLAFWVQAASAKLFGFGSWSLLAPQAIAGVGSVYVLYRIVTRQAGRGAGLIAALALAVTPITVAVNRGNNPDTMMIFLLLLAAWSVQAALQQGSRRLLALGGICVGLAFTTKMMAAYLIVPGLALAYFTAGPAGRWRRLVDLLGAGGVLVVTSGAWMTAVDAVPKRRRPYVGGSTNDTVRNLIVGYNGVGRLTGQNHNSFTRPVTAVHPAARPGLAGTSGTGLIFNHAVGGQIAWLIPFAVATLLTGLLLGGLALSGRRSPTPSARAGLIMWGGWSVVCWAVFSYSKGIFHPYYTSELAPGLAALTGIGVTTLVGLIRHRSPYTMLLAAGIAGNVAVAVVLLRRTPTWQPWLRPTTIAAGIVCAALIAALYLLRPGTTTTHRVTAAAGGAAVVALLLAPAGYAMTAVHRVADADPSAGPTVTSRVGSATPRPRRWPPPGAEPAAFGPDGVLIPTLMSYLIRHQDTATYLVAVTGDAAAQATIIRTGRPVLPMGGFGGGDPVPSIDGLRDLIHGGRLRFVIIGSTRGASLAAARNVWVQRNCAAVDPATYGQATTTASRGTRPARRVLFDCGPLPPNPRVD